MIYLIIQGGGWRNVTKCHTGGGGPGGGLKSVPYYLNGPIGKITLLNV